jgi:rhodanese-related sulfurtransferase
MKVIQYTLLFFMVLFMSGCYEGYISSEEAAILKEYLAPEKLKELTDNPRDTIWIIDVRPESAYNNGHIPTAKSYPSSVIIDRLDELPLTQYLILYCETGGRAQAVIKKLEENGYTKLMNWGGFTRWPYDFVK